MVATVVRAYRVALWFYPVEFRRRYAEEMRLDFEDALQEALSAGAISALLFACGQTADICSRLVREWSRGTRAGTLAATTLVTAAIWGLALRPWAWTRTIQPFNRSPFTTAPVEVWQLLAITLLAMMPVIALMVLGPGLVHLSGRKPQRENLRSLMGPPV